MWKSTEIFNSIIIHTASVRLKTFCRYFTDTQSLTTHKHLRGQAFNLGLGTLADGQTGKGGAEGELEPGSTRRLGSSTHKFMSDQGGFLDCL